MPRPKPEKAAARTSGEEEKAAAQERAREEALKAFKQQQHSAEKMAGGAPPVQAPEMPKAAKAAARTAAGREPEKQEPEAPAAGTRRREAQTDRSMFGQARLFVPPARCKFGGQLGGGEHVGGLCARRRCLPPGFHLVAAPGILQKGVQSLLDCIPLSEDSVTSLQAILALGTKKSKGAERADAEGGAPEQPPGSVVRQSKRSKPAAEEVPAGQWSPSSLSHSPAFSGDEWFGRRQSSSPLWDLQRTGGEQPGESR